jgi:hypothetical protein
VGKLQRHRFGSSGRPFFEFSVCTRACAQRAQPQMIFVTAIIVAEVYFLNHL